VASSAITYEVRRALDAALPVACPECPAGVDEVCVTEHDAPLLWPHVGRLAAARSHARRLEWSA
jgi:hypothetical protein